MPTLPLQDSPEIKIEAAPLRLEEVDYRDAAWESFVTAQSQCLFYHPVWSRILEAGYGSPTKIYLLKENDEIKLGLPAALFDFKWFRLIHAYTPYGDFLGDRRYSLLFIELLEKMLIQKGICQMRLTQLGRDRFAVPASYRSYEGCCHILNLTGLTEKTLEEGYKTNVRRDIRKAGRAGFVLKRLQTAGEIDAYYGLYRKAMRRHQAFGPHPRKLYQAIARELVPHGKAVFLAAQYQQRTIAGVILILSGDTVYFLGNASDPSFLHLRPNHFVIHEAILLALRKGFRFFDFMTTGEAYSGHGELSAFKEKWGAKRHPFVVYEKDLATLRAALWNRAWRWGSTPLGSAALRILLNR